MFANNAHLYSSFLSLHLFYYFLISRTDSSFTTDGFFKPFGTNCWRRAVLGRPQWRTVGLISSIPFQCECKEGARVRHFHTHPHSQGVRGVLSHIFCLHQQQLRGPLHTNRPLRPLEQSIVGVRRGELRAIRSNPASIIQALENYQHWHRCSCTVHISKATSLRTSIRYGNRLYDGVQTLLTPPVVGEIVAVWLHIHYGNQKRADNLTFPFSKWAKAFVLLVMTGWEMGDGGYNAGRQVPLNQNLSFWHFKEGSGGLLSMRSPLNV